MATDDLLRQLERARADALGCDSSPASPDCPDAGVWTQLLSRTGPQPPLAEAHVRHALVCDHCGPLLRQSAEAAASTSEPSAAEQDILQSLPSNQADAQRRLAQRLSRGQCPPRRAVWRWRALWSGLAAAVIVFLVVWVPGAGRADMAIWLLNRAYAQQRTLPLRFAGAGYGPLLSPRRGPSAPPNSDLLEAEGLLAAALARSPNNARLLQAQAHAALLRSDADGAIRSLTRALALQPALPNVHTDLGTAYYLRAAGGHDADYGTALDQLGQAIARHPKDAVARFNRALVEEALNDWAGAVDDWNSYLQLDARGPWASEARRHLQADRARVSRHDGTAYAPLLAPAQVTAAALGARSEAYLRAATVTWLPAAYPISGPPSLRARGASALLALQLRQHSADAWLDEMLAQPPSLPYARALALLSSAIVENRRGDADTALTHARQAEDLFRRAGSAAGARRAAFAQVYALHTAERGLQCLSVLDRDLAPAATLHEPWLAAQTALERYDCGAMAGLPDAGALDRARDLARRAGFPDLLMRVLAFQFAADPALVSTAPGAAPAASWPCTGASPSAPTVPISSKCSSPTTPRGASNGLPPNGSRRMPSPACATVPTPPISPWPANSWPASPSSAVSPPKPGASGSWPPLCLPSCRPRPPPPARGPTTKLISPATTWPAAAPPRRARCWRASAATSPRRARSRIMLCPTSPCSASGI